MRARVPPSGIRARFLDFFARGARRQFCTGFISLLMLAYDFVWQGMLFLFGTRVSPEDLEVCIRMPRAFLVIFLTFVMMSLAFPRPRKIPKSARELFSKIWNVFFGLRETLKSGEFRNARANVGRDSARAFRNAIYGFH